MATQGIEEVTENAIRAVARDCGSLSMECSDVAGYVKGVSERIGEHMKMLDQETCTLITLNAEFKPEEGLSGSQVRTRDGMITWKLPTSTTQLAAPQALAANTAPEKVICKKTIRTGTVAATERTCMTQRDWERQSAEEREAWGELQGKKGSTSGN